MLARIVVKIFAVAPRPAPSARRRAHKIPAKNVHGIFMSRVNIYI
jgi:hypothetical protein